MPSKYCLYCQHTYVSLKVWLYNIIIYLSAITFIGYVWITMMTNYINQVLKKYINNIHSCSLTFVCSFWLNIATSSLSIFHVTVRLTDFVSLLYALGNLLYKVTKQNAQSNDTKCTKQRYKIQHVMS